MFFCGVVCDLCCVLLQLLLLSFSVQQHHESRELARVLRSGGLMPWVACESCPPPVEWNASAPACLPPPPPRTRTNPLAPSPCTLPASHPHCRTRLPARTVSDGARRSMLPHGAAASMPLAGPTPPLSPTCGSRHIRALAPAVLTCHSGADRGRFGGACGVCAVCARWASALCRSATASTGPPGAASATTPRCRRGRRQPWPASFPRCAPCAGPRPPDGCGGSLVVASGAGLAVAAA